MELPFTGTDAESQFEKRRLNMLNIMHAIEWELDKIDRMLFYLSNDKTIPKRISVRQKTKNGNIYYYRVAKASGKRDDQYIGNAESDKVREIVKRSYKYELLKVLKEDRSLMEKMKALYKPYTPDSIMKKLSPCLADFKYKSTFDAKLEKMRMWAEADYKKNTTPFNNRVIVAKDGTRVRSKSECIIYNALLDAGLFFRYDPVLDLETPDPGFDGLEMVKSPDFQIICMDGTLILIEHAGKLSQKWYSDDLARKLQIYHYNGYVPGVNLYITADDKVGGFDTTAVAQMIEDITWRVYR